MIIVRCSRFSVSMDNVCAAINRKFRTLDGAEQCDLGSVRWTSRDAAATSKAHSKFGSGRVTGYRDL